MRTPDGRIKILDFGLARVDGSVATGADGLTAGLPGALTGTPAYMAPVQIEGRTVGPPADVFAFGVLMYEWMSGVHPFQAGSPLATLARVIDSTPEPLINRTQAPGWIAGVIDRCLRKSAADRFASAAELHEALDRPASAENAPSGGHAWWRTHQMAAIVLYMLATARAWQITDWLHEPISLWAFVLMGIFASVGGIVRGHLVFTDVMNPRHLPGELGRTNTTRLSADLVMAGVLAIDALLLASREPLAAVLTICLAVGIALAVILMEPTTTAAVFGE